MNIISPAIRITCATEIRPIRLFQDWEIDEERQTVFYGPASLLLEIGYADTMPVPLKALSARLAHSCQKVELPETEALIRIGQDALHAFFLVADVCQEPTDDDQIPF